MSEFSVSTLHPVRLAGAAQREGHCIGWKCMETLPFMSRVLFCFLELDFCGFVFQRALMLLRYFPMVQQKKGRDLGLNSQPETVIVDQWYSLTEGAANI